MELGQKDREHLLWTGEIPGARTRFLGGARVPPRGDVSAPFSSAGGGRGVRCARVPGRKELRAPLGGGLASGRS